MKGMLYRYRAEVETCLGERRQKWHFWFAGFCIFHYTTLA